MTPRELLFPRYKLKMNYPGNLMPVGYIWTHLPHWDNTFPTLMMDHYPNIFKKLKWWEDRAPSDLPQFVRHTSYAEVRIAQSWGPWQVTVETFPSDDNEKGVCFSMQWPLDSIKPATEEEYSVYLSVRQQNNSNPAKATNQ